MSFTVDMTPRLVVAGGHSMGGCRRPNGLLSVSVRYLSH